MTHKVLLWSPDGAGDHYHGPGSFAYRLYAGAPPGAFHIELAHASADQADYPLFAAQHRLAARPDGALGMARFLASSHDWLRRNAGRFDVMHALTGFHASVAPAGMARGFDLPCMLFVANHRLEFVDKGGLRGLLGLARRRRCIVRRLSAVIAMSRAIQEELLEIGVDARHIARIPMGVDTARFRPESDDDVRAALRAALGLRELPTVAFVGGITERKRPHLLVEALGVLARRGLELQLLLVGPEHEAGYCSALHDRVRELGLEGHVRFTGHVNDIERVLRAADVFSLPSAKEGMPAALVEAMATGLPAVTTRVSGTEDLIRHGENGQLIEPDAESIAAALAIYVEEPRLLRTHGASARATVLESCSSATVLRAYGRLIEIVQRGGDAADASTVRS